ncbi:flavin-containing monooxygenase 5-like [Ornithorhynchus anatinus]|uniref:Flavin-containing monooxygenase n=1 Tax=Ornithorhynchus anatinus TaxID=9258 RepID=F6Y3S3_ORNAN|nr:flavin-containing monooxygenase 5-like [Ornithorhynchus anatinus]
MGQKKVAVIGAGISGLGAIKCCLEEGLEPTCFEKSDDIGGLWRFREKTEDGAPSIYRSVTINTSKEMSCFSDFPIPDHFPNYMHNSQLLEYLRMYATHFDLLKHISFQTEVVSVRKRPDFPSSGQWDVTTEAAGKKESHVFDGILVCSGHHTEPHLPLDSFPGINRFKGHYFHSREYKSPEEFAGKRVVVIGVGNSGADVAVELSHTAKQVFLSTRQGAWIWNRVWDAGYPMDTVLFTRFNEVLKKTLTTSMLNDWAENKLNSRFDHANYGLQPQKRFLNSQVSINDNLPNHIISGRIVVKPNVKEFTESAAVFEDGSAEEPVDVVIFATGYTFSFPFFEKPAEVIDDQVSLFSRVFPPTLERPTLAFVGLVQPVGALIPTAELQSRWATRVFKGLCKLPSAEDMMVDIARKREAMEKRFAQSPRHCLQEDYIKYMDRLASLAGVKPSLPSLLLSDPKLAREVFFGPCTPYQYRLQGPGRWAGARRAILTQRGRILKPLRTGPVRSGPNLSRWPSWFMCLCVGAGLLLFVRSCC